MQDIANQKVIFFVISLGRDMILASLLQITIVRRCRSKNS